MSTAAHCREYRCTYISRLRYFQHSLFKILSLFVITHRLGSVADVASNASSVKRLICGFLSCILPSLFLSSSVLEPRQRNGSRGSAESARNCVCGRGTGEGRIRDAGQHQHMRMHMHTHHTHTPLPHPHHTTPHHTTPCTTHSMQFRIRLYLRTTLGETSAANAGRRQPQMGAGRDR